MPKVTQKTLYEVLAALSVNITSGWFGIVFIIPGFTGTISLREYFIILITYLPSGIVGFIVTLIISEKAKKL